jgi:hypothetical protein
MKDLDSAGVFWLPGHEDDRLSGRLVFSPRERNIVLSLVGIFENSPDKLAGTIFGAIDSGEVTLNDCFSTGGSHRFPGVSETKFHVNSMLLGHNFLDPNPKFVSTAVRFSDIDSWIGRSPIDDRELNDLRKVNSRVAIKLQSIEETRCSFSRGQVIVRQAWSYRDRGISGITLYQQPQISIEYDSPESLEDIVSDVGRIENFVALCIDAPIDLDEFIVRHPDIRVRMLSGSHSEHSQPVEYRAPRLKYRPPSERKERQDYQFLISYDEVGGVDALARWIDSSGRFQRALDSCMSTRHAQTMYTENRFMNITYAAEAFHRITRGGTCLDPDEFKDLMAAYLQVTPEEHKAWFLSRMKHGNDLALPKRLRELASNSRKVTRPLIGREGRWAQTIAQVRNELTHLGESPIKLKGSDLYFLSESVYAVLRICMLLESGVPEASLAAKSSSTAITWHARRVQEAIDRAREVLSLSKS